MNERVHGSKPSRYWLFCGHFRTSSQPNNEVLEEKNDVETVLSDDDLYPAGLTITGDII